MLFLAQHVALFEQDLCQLFEQLKELVFLDIYGKIEEEKAEQYRRMDRTAAWCGVRKRRDAVPSCDDRRDIERCATGGQQNKGAFEKNEESFPCRSMKMHISRRCRNENRSDGGMCRVNNGDERNQRLGEISTLTDRRDRLTCWCDILNRSTHKMTGS